MALRKNAKVELIRKVPLFSRCSRRELADIAMLADEMDFPEGRELIREGERGREFFVLVDGNVDVVRDGQKVATLGGGDFVGEVALVSRIPRIATVQTASPVRSLVISERTFSRLLDRAPQIRVKVLEALAERPAQSTHAPTL